MVTVAAIEGIKLDQEYRSFDLLKCYISHADSSAVIKFIHKDNIINVHIIPSDEKFKQDIIDNLLKVNRMMGLKIIFSKSLKISKTISYTVQL